MNFTKKSIIFLLPVLFTGCEVTNKEGLTRNLYSSLKSLTINSVDFIYPFLGFIGLILLALGIYTLFIKPQSPNETFINNLMSGTFEIIIAIVLIDAKQIAEYWFDM